MCVVHTYLGVRVVVHKERYIHTSTTLDENRAQTVGPNSTVGTPTDLGERKTKTTTSELDLENENVKVSNCLEIAPSVKRYERM